MTLSTRPLSYSCFFIFIGILCTTTPDLVRSQPLINGILELRRNSQTLLLTTYSDILIDSTLLVNFDSLQGSPDHFLFKTLKKRYKQTESQAQSKSPSDEYSTKKPLNH